MDPYGALSGTEAVKSPSVIAPAVELNWSALLMVMMAVPGVVTLKSADAPGMVVVKSLSVKQRGVVGEGQVDAADVLAGAERDRQAGGARGGHVDRLADSPG